MDDGTLTLAHAIWLEAERALDPELCARLGWHSSDRPIGNAIAIPFFSGGKVVNHKYRATDRKAFAQDSGGTCCFWNEEALHDATLDALPVVITEGEFDAASAIQSGWQRSVSVPNGAPAERISDDGASKYEYVRRVIDRLQTAREVILAVDADGPGSNLLHDLALRIGHARCKFVTYPWRERGNEDAGRCKDLNEVLQLYGAAGVNAVLLGARWLEVDGVYAMDELPPLPVLRTYPLGWGEAEDAFVRARMTDLWVITGYPGHGKTSFLNDVCCRLAKHGFRIAVASFEQPPQTLHKRNLRRWLVAQKRISADQPVDTAWTAEELREADAYINERFTFIVPKRGGPQRANVAWLLDRAEVAVVRRGCNVVVIDPWNALEHERGDLSLTEYVGAAIDALKDFAVKYQVLVVIVAHPAKPQKGEELTLYSVSDSAHWFNKPDLGMVLVRHDGEPTSVTVAKCRDEGEIGQRGTFKLQYVRDTGRFISVDQS